MDGGLWSKQVINMTMGTRRGSRTKWGGGGGGCKDGLKSAENFDVQQESKKRPRSLSLEVLKSRPEMNT